MKAIFRFYFLTLLEVFIIAVEHIGSVLLFAVIFFEMIFEEALLMVSFKFIHMQNIAKHNLLKKRCKKMVQKGHI